MTFDRLFSHVPAHQDDREDFENISRQSQLNKQVLLSQNPGDLPKQQAFPLEAISMWAGKENMMSDTGSSVRYHVHNTSQGENWPQLGY